MPWLEVLPSVVEGDLCFCINEILFYNLFSKEKLILISRAYVGLHVGCISPICKILASAEYSGKILNKR